MDLDDIRIFTKVVEAGSFTKAAKQLTLPKSTVSRRVADLEQALGARLLQRTTRSLTLTQAGEVYFAHTSRIAVDLQQARVALEEMQGEPRGTLRLTTPSDMSGMIPRLVGAFQEKYPHVSVIIFATGRRVDLVAEGYDVALRAGKLPDSSLVSRKLLDSKLKLYASPAYLKLHGTPKSIEDLKSHSVLCFGTEGPSGILRYRNATGTGEAKVTGRLASNDFGFLRSAALNGQGIAALPTLESEAEVQSGRLSVVLPDVEVNAGGVYAVHPSARLISPKVRAFIDFAAEWLTDCGKR